MSSTTASVLAHPGDTITWTSPDGRITVTLTLLDSGLYHVAVYQGTLRLDDLCGSHEREVDARAVARGYAVMFRDEHPAPALAELAAAGSYRQVRPTMAGAHLADISPAGQRAINSHRNGVVYAGEGVARTTLNALARKGFGTLVFEGRRRRITALTLNKRGMAAVKAGA